MPKKKASVNSSDFTYKVGDRVRIREWAEPPLDDAVYVLPPPPTAEDRARLGLTPRSNK